MRKAGEGKAGEGKAGEGGAGDGTEHYVFSRGSDSDVYDGERSTYPGRARGILSQATPVWANILAVHDNIKMELSYRQNGTWQYPGSTGEDFCTGEGEWQRLEARLDLSQISGLEMVQSITRNAGSNSIPAYWDDIQLMTQAPSSDTYDVQVATDAGFTNLIQNETGLEAQSLEVGSLAKATTYQWRVRAHNAAGPGPWSAATVTTIDRAPRRYYVKDHLGSIRAVVDPDASGSETDKVVETRDYYPFGLRMPGRNVTPGTETQEDYTGHELDSETGMHYAGARYYMGALGRWNGTDPILREQTPGKLLKSSPRVLTVSPYDYVFGNPTGLTDPDGRLPCCFPALWTPESAKAAARVVAPVVNFIGETLGLTPQVANAPGPRDPTYGESTPFNELSTGEQITVGLATGAGLFGGRLGGRAVSEGVEALAKQGRKIFSKLSDGDRLPVDDVLDTAQQFLGERYKEIDSGVFLSRDGKRMVRMTKNDLSGHGGRGPGSKPHLNFEIGETVSKPNGGFSFVREEGGNKHIQIVE